MKPPNRPPPCDLSSFFGSSFFGADDADTLDGGAAGLGAPEKPELLDVLDGDVFGRGRFPLEGCELEGGVFGRGAFPPEGGWLDGRGAFELLPGEPTRSRGLPPLLDEPVEGEPPVGERGYGWTFPGELPPAPGGRAPLEGGGVPGERIGLGTLPEDEPPGGAPDPVGRAGVDGIPAPPTRAPALPGADGLLNRLSSSSSSSS